MRICIIGDGAMATVCAQILSDKQGAQRPQGITIWGRNPEPHCGASRGSGKSAVSAGGGVVGGGSF